MVFSSLKFIGIFLPVLLICYSLVTTEHKKYILLLGSILFYAAGEPVYVVIFVTSLIINYWLSLLMGKPAQNVKRFFFILAILWNVGLLFFFKYYDFFAGEVDKLIGFERIPILGLALPLGISFYTFQIISYQIDLYKGKIQRANSFTDLSVYVSMFPQLVAGPIVRFDDISEEIIKPVFTLANVESGLKTFTIGLGLKVLLANQISTLFFSIQQIGAHNLDISMAWLGALSYTFQIYFDFWGYSLMAIGLGEMLGYRLPINFNQPYIAKSVTDFWRRWHITLSGWFRDYIYIPLGGNRKGRIRMIFNLFIVWALTGFWHGASWNFLLWGLFFFVLIVIERTGLGKLLEKTHVLGHVYIMLIIPISWMIFAQTDLHVLKDYILAMVGANYADSMIDTVHIVRYLKEYSWLLALCVLFSTPLPMKLYEKFKKNIITDLILFAIFWLSVYEIYLGKNNPFLYFRF